VRIGEYRFTYATTFEFAVKIQKEVWEIGMGQKGVINSAAVSKGTVYFPLKKVYFLFNYFRKRNKDISEGISIPLET
jgi:hypothetical protein